MPARARRTNRGHGPDEAAAQMRTSLSRRYLVPAGPCALLLALAAPAVATTAGRAGPAGVAHTSAARPTQVPERDRLRHRGRQPAAAGDLQRHHERPVVLGLVR